MKTDELHIRLQSPEDPIPYTLLLLADPLQTQINAYLATGKCYVAYFMGNQVGVLVTTPVNNVLLEIKNIAIEPLYQNKGLGSKLIDFAEQLAKKQGYKTLQIATGNSSIGQLYLYQKQGFEMTELHIDHFCNHYPEPIMENGIQCKHLVVLQKDL